MSSQTKRRLLLLLASKGHQRNALSKGFTLVELMIVIVIVGILSAVALPNFLSQTDKAKITEAKTNISAIIKQAQAKYLEDGATPSSSAADLTTNYSAPPVDKTKFNYTGSFSSPVYQVTATGNATDSGLSGKKIIGCVNFTSGLVKVTSKLDEAAPSCT